MDDTPRRWRQQIPVAGFAALASVLVFSQVTQEALDVDENVFVASAALLARNSALIYRDFHYNHMPTQVLLFAGLFKLTDHLLLAARCFSAACAVAAATVIFHFARRAFGHLPPRRRLFFAAGVALLLLFDPLFSDTAGKAWNHDLSVLGCLLGFLALIHSFRGGAPSGPRGGWALLSGICAAVAVTTRLTFAPAMLAFVLFICLAPAPGLSAGLTRFARVRLLALFGIGLLIASLPSIWVWAQAPRAAFFGNFLYPQLNTQFHIDDHTSRPFTLAARLGYVVKTLFTLPGNGVVTLGFVALMAVVLRLRSIRTSAVQCQLFCLLVMVTCLFAASFAAAPMYRQYLYAPTPFMILAIILCLRESTLLEKLSFQKSFAALVVLCVAAGANEYNGLAGLPWGSRWVPMQVHADGMRLAALMHRPGGTDGAGPAVQRVLTLYPIYPLEGGLDIYPELATGRFGLRVGRYLSSEQEAAYKMADVDEVAGWFTSRPPDAMLVVWTDPGLEGRLRSAAEHEHYGLTTLSPKRLLYLRPGASWVSDGLVRRGQAALANPSQAVVQLGY